MFVRPQCGSTTDNVHDIRSRGQEVKRSRRLNRNRENDSRQCRRASSVGRTCTCTCALVFGEFCGLEFRQQCCLFFFSSFLLTSSYKNSKNKSRFRKSMGVDEGAPEVLCHTRSESRTQRYRRIQEIIIPPRTPFQLKCNKSINQSINPPQCTGARHRAQQ